MTLTYLSLKPEQPIRTGGIKIGGGYLDTQDYLPGSVVRGALAEWLKLQGLESQIRDTVSRLRFGNFFPSTDAQLWSLPFPTTAVECKLHGGFKTSPGSEGHGIRDTLLAAVAYSELIKSGARFPVPFLLRCLEAKHRDQPEICYGRLERVAGYYIRRDGRYSQIRPEEVLQTKVALSRHRRAAREAMLYRVVALAPGLRGEGTPLYFVGRIWTQEPSLIDRLCQAVSEVGVGGLTTRGFGRVTCSTATIAVKPLAQRLRDFNAKLASAWQELAELANQCGAAVSSSPHGSYFSVDLLSPAHLTDGDGLPTLRLVLSYQGRDLEPIWWSAQSAYLGGFSTAWGLPKPSALGVAAGSTYVYRVDGNPEDLVSWLENLEHQGVGLRTDEGLGEVLICHPFHEEVEPV
ncbi:hypothetical protein HRbin36_01329 [bacterium HR36]|nr:hypothetical protein HRbin36_01329 [bacterium HR36]